MYCGLGLEEPTDDIAPDVASVRSLMGELPPLVSNTQSGSGVGVVAEVQDVLASTTFKPDGR